MNDKKTKTKRMKKTLLIILLILLLILLVKLGIDLQQESQIKDNSQYKSMKIGENVSENRVNEITENQIPENEVTNSKREEQEKIEENSNKQIEITENTNEIDKVWSEKGHEVIAKLEIPSIKLNTNILKEYNESLLKISVAKFFGADPNTIRKFLCSRT